MMNRRGRETWRIDAVNRIRIPRTWRAGIGRGESVEQQGGRIEDKTEWRRGQQGLERREEKEEHTRLLRQAAQRD